ncbi:MarR family transcriptional regulator [Microbacterium sp. NPDC076911]|uniref:MarR family winged helix-turn-helix transcriptional regulator n=1 Tax=Microbacterium sp. NPDC076911 TaxID=3154958 RepID=UPI00343906C5
MSERWIPASDRDVVVMRTLHAIRALSDAMDRMHGGMKGDMDMNITDLATLRMLIMREQRKQTVSPHDIAEHLRISTASTTKLLDRLVASGYVTRQPHPSDRRSRVVELTDLSRQEFFTHFGDYLRAMRQVSHPYSDEELEVVSRFMLELSEAIDPA